MSGTSRYEIDIIANNKAARALSKTNKQLQRIDKSAKTTNGSFKMMAGLAAGLATAFAGIKLASSFLDTAKQFENLGVQLKYITGNAEDGAKALGIVEAAASKSAFAMSDMANAAPLLLTVGTVDDLGDTLEMVGDIAAATGIDFNTVAEQIQRAFSGGIASADIFREKGVKSMLGFKEGVKYSAAETERHIREAFENGTTSLKGATAEMAETWSGQVSMMGDAWDQFKLKTMESGLFPALKSELGDLQKYIAANKDEIDKLAIALGESLADLLVWSIEWGKTFVQLGKDISELVSLWESGLTIFGVMPSNERALELAIKAEKEKLRILNLQKTTIDNMWDIPGAKGFMSWWSQATEGNVFSNLQSEIAESTESLRELEKELDTVLNGEKYKVQGDIIDKKIEKDLLDTGTAVDGLTKSYTNLATTLTEVTTPINTNTDMLTKLKEKTYHATEIMAGSFIPAITTGTGMLTKLSDAIFKTIHPTEIMAQTFYRSSTEMLSHNAPAVQTYADNWVHATDIMGAAHDKAVALKNELAEQAESIQQLTDKYDPLGAAYRRTEEDMKKANDMYKGREHLQAYKDLIKDISDKQDDLTKRIEGTNTALGNTSKAFRETTEDIRSDSEKFVDSFNKDFNRKLADGLANGTLGFQTFAGSWRKILADLINDTLNGGSLLKDILGMFGSLFGGGGGGGGNSFGSMFQFAGPMDYLQTSPLASSMAPGPFDYFADGGHINAGRSGIVGEAGPELISGPATVTPMAALGSKPNVNITIQAIDTQTGTEFLLKNKKQIEGIIQHAYNRRGKQGIY